MLHGQILVSYIISIKKTKKIFKTFLKFESENELGMKNLICTRT